MTNETMRWILAFDSSCGSCRHIAQTVAQSCDDRLEVLPLSHPDVVAWRTGALGPDPAWAPTLLRVDGDRVRAWTGRGMAAPLVRCLGPKATLDVLRALGQLRHDEAREAAGRPVAEGGALSRKGFLRLGTGAVVAGGLVLAGRVPAYAGPDPATRWAQANRARLPQRYDEVTALPLDYRRATYRELSPATRSRLWTEQLTRYRQAHPHLTAPQRQVLDAATSLARTESTFAPTSTLTPQHAQHQRAQAEAAFGADEARRLFATLGPDTDSPASRHSSTGPADQRGCTCATTDDWCNNSTHCFRTNCVNNSGCGWFWNSNCDGLCRN